MSGKARNSTSVYGALNPVQMKNITTENMYLRLFGEIAMNRFIWKGLPEEIDPRFVELTLYMRALSVFFKEEKQYNKYMALRGAGAGGYDMYDNFKKYVVYGNSMISATLEAENCVPIWANSLRIPELDVVSIYANRLAQLDRTIDNNILLLRKSMIFTADNNKRLTLMNIWRQTQDGEPVMFGSEELNSTITQGVVSLPNVVQARTVQDLQIAKSRIWNEAMTFLGINNANQDKRERLVSDEVDANNAQVDGFRNSALGARQLACTQIKRKYGLDVKCEWNDTAGQSLTDEPSLGQQDVTDNKQGGE